MRAGKERNVNLEKRNAKSPTARGMVTASTEFVTVSPDIRDLIVIRVSCDIFHFLEHSFIPLCSGRAMLLSSLHVEPYLRDLFATI